MSSWQSGAGRWWPWPSFGSLHDKRLIYIALALNTTRQLLIFFGIAYAFAWTVEAWMLIAHVRIEFAILASCGPTLAALATNRLARGHYRAFRFNVNWPRTLGTTALGVFLVITSIMVFPAAGLADAGKLNWSALFALGNYNYSTLLGGPLTEEPGWRGFALPRLQSRFHPVVASVVLGTLWAAWHLPFFFYPGWTQCPVLTYFLLMIALSILMTFVTNLARFGVIAPIAMHAVFNTSGRYFQGLFAQTNPGDGGLLNTLVHLVPMAQRWQPGNQITIPTLMTIGAWSAAILLIALTKGRLGYSPALGLSFSRGNTVDNKEREA